MKTQRLRLAGTGHVKRSAAQPPADCKPPSKDFGVPSRERYDDLVKEYIQSLSTRKRDKCLISQDMFDDVWDVLHNPSDAKIRTPQFRFWVRKMFKLGSVPGKSPTADEEDIVQVIMHEDRPVAVKEQVYDILSYYHTLSGHAGRDRTMAEVKRSYSWVPKELVARFVKICPTCVFKKTGVATTLPVADSTESVSFNEPRILRPSPSEDFEEGTVSSSYSQAVSLASSEEGYFVDSAYESSPCSSAGLVPSMASLMQSRILPTPILSPFLRSPPLGSPNLSADPRKWLADLAMQPGPSFSVGTSHKFPPLSLRRTASETGVDPIHAPSTRITLPPLMKALSENMADQDSHRPGYNVPGALNIPRRVSNGSILEEDVDMADPTYGGLYTWEDDVDSGYSNIDPSLLRGALPVVNEFGSQFYQQGNNASSSRPFSSFALTANLDQSVIVPVNVDYRVTAMRRSDSEDSVSSVASSVRSDRSQGSSASFQGLRRVSNTSAKNPEGIKQSDSFDPQDWESSYCLEEV